MHVIIVGAGPAGLAAALALHQRSTPSSPIQVTVLELRPRIETLGGAVNLTPLAMRYLDALGVGSRLRPLGIKVGYIELVSHRTGTSLGKLWPNADALRVQRHDIVDSMMETTLELPQASVVVRFGVRVQSIEEKGTADGEGHVIVQLLDTSSGKNETIQGDILLGCDGIHSFVRSRVVDTERKKIYSGKATSYGYIPVSEPGLVPMTLLGGKPAVSDTTLVTAQKGSLLCTFFEPKRDRVYLAAVLSEAEKQDARDGWKAMGSDKEGLKREIRARFEGGKIEGLGAALEECEDWFFFPVYMLPSGGTWTKGRVLLLGDSAHAVSDLHPPSPTTN
jgi:2-polyprenyl-6-methoxyphenol hydroxylase-like FAD-dependent oxidoreductase